jgi:hypothetical protein
MVLQMVCWPHRTVLQMVPETEEEVWFESRSQVPLCIPPFHLIASVSPRVNENVAHLGKRMEGKAVSSLIS